MILDNHLCRCTNVSCLFLFYGIALLLASICNSFLFILVGVQKERMASDDMYVLSSDGFILSTPAFKPYPHQHHKCTDCAPIFMKVLICLLISCF